MRGAGMKCIKYLLFLFNLIFVIMGIALIAVGISTKVFAAKYFEFLKMNVVDVPSNLLIAVGALVFVVAFFGCCGAWKENHCMIMIYTVSLGILLGIELGAASTAFSLSGDIETLLENGLNKTMAEYGHNSTIGKSSTKAWDLTQKNLKCCGIESYNDWTHFNNTPKIPISCCVEQKDKCSTIDGYDSAIADRIYTKGCMKSVLSDISIDKLGGIAIGLACLQLFTIVCSGLIAGKMREPYEQV